MGRGEREGKAPDWLRGEPSRGLARDMSGVVVENNLNGGIGGVGRVKQLEELDEFAAPAAFLEQSMEVTGEEIDPCHQGQGAVALVFVIAHHSRAFARQGWAIRRGRSDRLDPGLLVIRDEGEAPAAVFALAPACPRSIATCRYTQRISAIL